MEGFATNDADIAPLVEKGVFRRTANANLLILNRLLDVKGVLVEESIAYEQVDWLRAYQTLKSQ